MSQAALADAVALDRSSLAKIEGGSRRLTALELARIADVLGERIEWFLTEPPPSIVSHRNVVQPGAPSASVEKLAERISRNVEFVLRQDRRFDLAATPDFVRPDTVSGIEGAAQRTRALLDLDDREPFLRSSDLVSGLGLLCFSLDLGSEAADAASILLPRGGVALVNGDRQVGRRRLALAHELGHFVFADEYNIDWRIAEQLDAATWESRLDRYARAVLLPAAGLDEVWSRARARSDELRDAAVVTASAFRVDMSTLARRLFELDRIDRADADRVRAVRTTKADIVEHDLLVADELAAPSLSRVYEQSVLRLYRGEVISAARALDLLIGVWEEDDLPPLPRLPEDAIWELV